MSGGVALGMFAGSIYEAGEVHMQPGDALLLYSDGLTEAESPDGSRSTKPGSNARWRYMRAPIRNLRRPSWVGRFSTRLSVIAGISGFPTTSPCWF